MYHAVCTKPDAKKYEKYIVLWLGASLATQRRVEKTDNNLRLWGGWYTDGRKNQ